jgi:hypothetical protein
MNTQSTFQGRTSAGERADSWAADVASSRLLDGSLHTEEADPFHGHRKHHGG